jgi:O-antigen ligase
VLSAHNMLPERTIELVPAALGRGTSGKVMAAAALAVMAVALFYALVHLGIEPMWVLTGAALLPLALFAMRCWPMILMTALLFVGNFKNVPAQGITWTDPTMLLLLLCAGALVLELLFDVSGTSEWSVSRLVAGQGAVILVFLLFNAVLLISFSYTQAIEYGAMKTMRFAVFETLAFLAPILLLKRKDDLDQLVKATVVLSLLLMARDVLSLLNPPKRVLEGSIDITQIGDGMLLAITILIVMYHGAARSRAINYGLSVVLVVGLIASAARSPMVALLVTVLICGWRGSNILNIFSHKKVLVGVAVALLVAFASLMWFAELPGVGTKLAWKEAELAAFTSGSALSAGTIGERLSFYRSAMEAVKENPVLGLGAGGWSTYYSKLGTTRFPHNFLLEVAAEQGLVGFVLLISLLAMLFRSAYRLKSYHQLAFLFPVLLFCTIYNAVTGDIENRHLWFWLGMVAAGSRMARDHNALPVIPQADFRFTY